MPVAPRARRYSILPAASVVILAALILLIVGATNALDTSQVVPTTLPAIVGALPAASPAADASLYVGAVRDGVPPTDIASALIAPRGTTKIKNLLTGGEGEGDYDRATSFRVAAPRARVFGFYRANLEALGWKLFSSGIAPGDGGDELLFQKGGSDGWYWETGVIAPLTADGATIFEFRIFQAADAS